MINKPILTFVSICILFFSCAEKGHNEKNNAESADFNPSPSPEYLSPAESMKTMNLPEGYHLQLVASEPMIKEPVAVAWDGDARMYVAEMMTYMQDADATGEQRPLSRISLLEDTDNDGTMDKSSVFVDSLLLPRMLQCVGHELLVNETNSINISSYRDTNGDGKADVKKLLYKNDKYVVNDANMEHQRSGLDWNLDNWMYVTYEPVRFRYTSGKIEVDSITGGSPGQWGLTHDNYGRLFYSTAGGETPVLGFQINPVYGRLDFDDQFSPEFQEVWPVIATPDVQGGEKRLRANRTLNHFTGCSGQSIFRGDHLPKDLVGDYILCEPVARIIRRAKVIDKNGKIFLENAYDKKEFVSSSDMNFRPVNSATGPDGNLYIVDMNRGIIQQGNWTKPGSFLRKKIDSLGLAKNTGHGRIYRIIHDGFKQGPKPAMLEEPVDKLLAYLGHPNGWWRDNAQKELIIRGDRSVIPALKAIATSEQQSIASDSGHLARIHALWTLEGLNAIDKDLLLQAFNDKNPQVRKTAVWISESYLKKNDEQVIQAVGKLKNDPSYDVRVQLLLSLYTSKSNNAKNIIREILDDNKDNEMLAAAKTALDKNEDKRKLSSRLGNFTMEERNSILSGAAIFKSFCSSCHGADGKGMTAGGAGLAAPPLVNSGRLALGNKDIAISILLNGLTGPVNGKAYAAEMPAMKANSDRWIAAVASYVRYEFGDYKHGKSKQSPVVNRQEVKAIRQKDSARVKPWTLAELQNKK